MKLFNRSKPTTEFDETEPRVDNTQMPNGVIGRLVEGAGQVDTGDLGEKRAFKPFNLHGVTSRFRSLELRRAHGVSVKAPPMDDRECR